MKDYILGVDLGGTNIKAAAYRLESYEKVGEKRLPTQVEGGWEHVLGRVLAALEELLRQMPRERVLCVGMGVPGLPGGGEPCPGHLPGGVRNRHRPAGGRRRDAGGRRLRRPPHGGGRPDVSRKKSFRFNVLFMLLPYTDGTERDTGPCEIAIQEVTTMKKNNLWKLAGALALTAVLAGCSSSISQEEATTIALEHAGVAKEDAVSLSVQQEHEDGRDIFEVKFSTQDTEYSYDVAQKDGEIINYNYDSTGTPPAGASEGSSASGTEAQAVQEEIDKTQQDQSADESQAQAVEDAVDEATAINAALEHAGVTECYMHRVELDTEDGREVYEIEFFSGNTEYDYTVARDTGEILSYDQDIEGWGLGQGNGQGNGNGRQNGQGNSTSSTAAGPITLEEAVQLVLDRVPGASSEDVRIQLEEEDGRQVYEGEVICNRAEHEFEIDAATGDFIQWSVDYQD